MNQGREKKCGNDPKSPWRREVALVQRDGGLEGPGWSRRSGDRPLQRASARLRGRDKHGHQVLHHLGTQHLSASFDDAGGAGAGGSFRKSGGVPSVLPVPQRARLSHLRVGQDRSCGPAQGIVSGGGKGPAETRGLVPLVIYWKRGVRGEPHFQSSHPSKAAF